MMSEGIITEMANKATNALAERREKQLLGAWRAGYDYVHVYDGLHCAGVRLDAFSIQEYHIVTNEKNPPRPDTFVYKYTYDIEAMDDEEILAGIKEEMD